MSNLLFLGDFFYDYDTIENDIEEIAHWIKKNEFQVVLNLEGPLSNRSKPIKKRGPNLSQTAITIDILKDLNVVGVCLANNHIMDYGEQALKDTIEILNKNHILHTGAGENLEEAVKPFIIQIDNQKVIVQNFGWDIEETVYATDTTSGSSPRIEELILENTVKLRGLYKDAIIVNVYHWGFEYNLYPMPLDVELAHKSINSGCDLIIGHHPHNIQPYENYKDKDIYYSLGNFYFASRRSNFKNKVFDNDIKNMCDYGAAVIFDIQSHQTKTVFIKYNLENNKSRILKESIREDLLVDITGLNHTNKGYVRKVKKGSININPILTLNKKTNALKILKLYTYYNVLRVLRLVFKFPFFRRLYYLIRKKIHP